MICQPTTRFLIGLPYTTEYIRHAVGFFFFFDIDDVRKLEVLQGENTPLSRIVYAYMLLHGITLRLIQLAHTVRTTPFSESGPLTDEDDFSDLEEDYPNNFDSR